MWSPAWEPVGLAFTYALLGQKAMAARREAQRISRIFASRATKQTRFLAATRRDGALWAHFCVTRPHHIGDMLSGSRLELRPNRLPVACAKPSLAGSLDGHPRRTVPSHVLPARPTP